MKKASIILSILTLGGSVLKAQECNIIPSRNGFEWIENVKIGELDYTSGKSLTRSDNFSEEMIIGESLEAGDIVNVELTPGYKSRSYEEYWRIWIDIDGDNYFSDSEIVFQTKGKGTVSGTLTIPEGGNGNSKVKVAMNWKYYPTCESHQSGEIEYYSADITPTIVSTADFTLPVTIPIISVIDAPSTLDIQGTANNTDKKLTVNIPYTNGEGSYNAFTGEYVINNANTGKNGETNSFRITYPAGDFAPTGSIPVTIEIDDDGTFDAKQVAIAAQETLATLDFKVNGQSKGNINLEILGGIPDRNFADPDHKFIYLPITAPDGSTWLNNNLGANYSNVNNSAFNPLQIATSTNDYNAYGSLFQWGRYSDGHELINHTSSGSTPINSDTNLVSSTESPDHKLFIIQSSIWNSTNNTNLWQGESGTNNPCPEGYRIPNSNELQSLINNPVSYANDGFRSWSNGSISLNQLGYWWSSEALSQSHAEFSINISNIANDVKSFGLGVRCIKD